jgi:hypothetical protein
VEAEQLALQGLAKKPKDNITRLFLAQAILSQERFGDCQMVLNELYERIVRPTEDMLYFKSI